MIMHAMQMWEGRDNRLGLIKPAPDDELRGPNLHYSQYDVIMHDADTIMVFHDDMTSKHFLHAHPPECAGLRWALCTGCRPCKSSW